MHAILIGVSGYPETLGDLDFAPEAVRGLAGVLETHFGYTTTVLIEPGLSSEGINKAVEHAMETAGPGTTLLVHVLAHGHHQDSGHFYALGTDLGKNAEVGNWLQRLHARRGAPTVLFLLDMCRAGLVARFGWLDDYTGDDRRGWVLAACTDGELAYNGTFTVALANVLRDAAVGDSGMSAASRFLPLGTIARAVRAETERLRLKRGDWKQVVTGSLADIADSLERAAFFPRPAHLSGAVSGRAADLTALPFLDGLDEGVDARHFVSCATGAGGFAEPGVSAGCFAGREKELVLLTSWLVGGDAPLAVVTGGPGAGKSALLGILVCAAHPRLRDETGALWRAAAVAPPKLPGLAAVNCRQRGLTEITASLGRQFGLPEDPEPLLAELAKGTGVRLLVADGLDEADRPAEVAAWLGALARTTLFDGRSAVRLLAATRDEPETRELLDLAGSKGHLVDLDAVDPKTLERDLHAYVTHLVKSAGIDETGAVAGVFATAVAGGLATAGGGHGEFLVASIHTRRFVDSFRSGAPGGEAGIQEALRYGRKVRPSPAEAFRIDLAAGHGSWLEASLTALAHARSDGMPLSVLTRAARVFRPESEPPSMADIRAALDSRGFYLRRSTDSEGMTVYRLFHEELIQYLRDAGGADGLPEALLDSLGAADSRVWSAAEPYVLRHILDHAAGTSVEGELLADPGFLLRAAPAALEDSLAWANSPLRRLLPAASPFEDRRAAFALAATAAGEHSVSDRIAVLPGEVPLAWRPAWSRDHTTARPVPARRHTGVLLTGRRLLLWGPRGTEEIEKVTAFAFLAHDGTTALVTGHPDGEIRLWGADGDRSWKNPAASAVTSLVTLEVDGGSFAVSGHRSGQIFAVDLAGHEAPVLLEDSLARGNVQVVLGEGASPVLAWVDDTGFLVTVDVRSCLGRNGLTGGRVSPRNTWLPGLDLLSFALTEVGGRMTLVAGYRDGTVQIFDYHTHTLLKTLTPAVTPPQPLSECGVTCGRLDGRAVVVYAGPDGTVQVFDALTGRAVSVFQTDLGPLWSVSVAETDGRLLCLLTGAQGAGVWELGGRGAEPFFGLTDLPATAGALTGGSGGPDGLVGLRWKAVAGRAADRQVLVLASNEGVVRCLDAATGEEALPPLPRFGETLVRLEITDMAGTPVAILQTAENIRVWNLVDGSTGLIPQPRQDRTRWGNTDIAHVFVGGRLVALTGDSLGRVFRDGERLGEQGAPVTALAGARIGGRPCAVTGGEDGSVLVWDLETGRATARLDLGAPVRGLACTPEDVLMVVTGHRTVAFRWGQRHQRKGDSSSATSEVRR